MHEFIKLYMFEDTKKAFLFSLSAINIVVFKFVVKFVMPLHLKIFGYIGK